MKLSEAIRLGAMLHPQCFRQKYERNSHMEIVASCAMGAAQLASERSFEYTLVGDFQCPACDEDAALFLDDLVVHLNDKHRWTREAIADWVQTVEPADVPAPSTAEPSPIYAVDPVLAGSVSGPRAKDRP